MGHLHSSIQEDLTVGREIEIPLHSIVEMI